MALPSFLPFFVSTPPRFHPSSSFIRHFLYRSRVTFLFFFLLFSLISLLFFPSFVSSLVPLPLLIDYYRDYLPLNISLFSPFRHNFYAFIVPLRLDVLFTEPLWSSALFPLLFPPSYNAWNDFLLCTPIHICTLRHLSYFGLTFALVMTGITNILNFLLRFMHSFPRFWLCIL